MFNWAWVIVLTCNMPSGQAIFEMDVPPLSKICSHMNSSSLLCSYYHTIYLVMSFHGISDFQLTSPVRFFFHLEFRDSFEQASSAGLRGLVEHLQAKCIPGCFHGACWAGTEDIGLFSGWVAFMSTVLYSVISSGVTGWLLLFRACWNRKRHSLCSKVMLNAARSCGE